MRWHEIESGMRLPVSGEEQEIIDRAAGTDDGTVARDELDERGQEVARLMVSKGLLHRVRKGDEVKFKVSSVKDVWRDR